MRAAFRAFAAGIAVALAAIAAGAWLVVQNGWVPARADTPTPPLEKWASRSVTRAIRRDSASLTSPLQPTDENLLAGVKIYGTDCAICHGAADGKASAIAKGFFLPAPQLAKHGVEDDAVGRTYYKIKHGMRFTPMPAFGETLDDRQIWQVALFLKQMDDLTPRAAAEWRRLPSVASPGGT